MRTKDLFDLVRHKINDKCDSTNLEGRYNSNFDIQEWINAWVRALLLDQVEADRSWHNSVFDLAASDAVQDSARVYNYTLPPYITRITLVRDNANATSVESPRGRIISPVAPGTSNRGWYWLDTQRIFLQGETQGLDMRIWGTKIPPKVHFGQIRYAVVDLDKFYLDDEPQQTGNTPLSVSPDTNAYKDTYFAFTGTAGTPVITHDLGGIVKRCISSQRVWVAAANDYLMEITLDSDLPEAAALADTYEMVVPISAAHADYLSILVAESLFHRTNNTKGIEALQPQKRELHSRFINGIQPRQDQAPWQFQFPEESQVGDFDPDRDPWAIYYGTIF